MDTFAASSDADWFALKLQRAAKWRARGNDAFKAEKLAKAVRAYKQVRWERVGNAVSASVCACVCAHSCSTGRQAIQWLACPAECVYDHEEAAQVAPVALACHSNLATSLWKLGQVDACIAQATLALEHDPTSVKALFRRSQALVETKAFDDAVHDLERARELEPANKLLSTCVN